MASKKRASAPKKREKERGLVPYDPFRRIREMQEDINSAFDDFWAPSFFERAYPAEFREPAIQVEDLGKQLRVTAELPGVDKKGITVEVDERNVTISAEQGKKKGGKQKGYFYSEMSSQKFYRQTSLPSPVVPQKAKTRFSNGVLEIDLPKREGISLHRKVKLKP